MNVVQIGTAFSLCEGDMYLAGGGAGYPLPPGLLWVAGHHEPPDCVVATMIYIPQHVESIVDVQLSEVLLDAVAQRLIVMPDIIPGFSFQHA